MADLKIVTNVKSSQDTVKYGVPQGSILGPILFLLYINDIVNIPGCSEIVLYADDTNVFFSGNDESSVFREANMWLHHLDSWLTSSKLDLNINKTKYLMFKPKGTRKEIDLNLKFRNSVINQSITTRFLGVLFHENLFWDRHIDSLRIELSRVVGILNRLRYYLSTSVKKQIYYALFHSRLTYCFLVWSKINAKKPNVSSVSPKPFNTCYCKHFKNRKLLAILQDLWYTEY